MPLSVARIYFPVKTLGPGQRVGIWTAGCNRNCIGCISPELQSVKAGQALSSREIIEIIRRIGRVPDGFTISGGEPFLQIKALCDLIEELVLVADDVLIFTGYTLNELVGRHDDRIDRVISLCSAIVDGPYVDELNDGIGLRGSSNQKLHVFKHYERYSGLDTGKREVQTVLYGNKLLTIGIPEVKK